MTPIVFTIARFTFIEALRNRLVWLVLTCVGGGLLGAEFLAHVALTETLAYQSGLLGAYLRLAAVVVLSLFVVTTMVREFNDKGFELLLSLPITRSAYLAGKLGGFAALAIAIGAVCSLAVLPYADTTQVLIWGVSLICELLLVTALSMLCLFTVQQVPAAIAVVLAFYLLARSVAAFQLIGTGPLRFEGDAGGAIIVTMIDALAYVLPELHRFTQSSWLMYADGDVADLLAVVGQSLIYVVLLVAAALFDLSRKNL